MAGLITFLPSSISNDLTNAREYGSIINVQPVDFSGLIERIGVIAQSDELNLIAMENKRIACEKILPLVNQAQALSQKYDVVCTNPPYMGGSGMNSVLSEYVKRCYSEAKSDLFAALIIKCLEFTKQNGYSSLVTMQSWMFLSSFEEMRTKLLTLNTLTTLMHMENMVMGIAFGTAVSVFRKGAVKGYKGTYNQIKLADIENAKPKSFPVAGNRFAQVSSDNFSKIPGMPVAYTGTHDNETLVSWYQTVTDAERAMVRDYLYDYATPEEQLYQSMIALI